MNPIFFVALGLTAPVFEDAPPPAAFTLEWEAPEACPSRASIEALVAELVADRVDGEGTMAVRGAVTEAPGGYRLALTMTLGERHGDRALEAERCDDLAQSVALLVAVTMVPTLNDDVVEPEPEPEPESEPDPELPPTAPIPSAAIEPVPAAEPRVPPRRSVPTALLRVGLGVDVGGNPSASFATRLAVGVAWPHARVNLEGSWIAPRRVGGPRDTAALVQQGLVAATGCGVPTWSSWSFPICGGVEVGILRAQSRGVSPRTTAAGRLVTPLLRAGAVRRWRRVGAWFDLEGLARGATTRVVVAGDEIFRPNVVWFRVLVGIEVALGGKSPASGQGS